MSPASRCSAGLLLLFWLGLLGPGCPAHQSAGHRGSGDEEGSSEEGDADKDKDRDNDKDKDEDAGRSGGDEGDEGDSTVKIRHKELGDAIRENSETGRPRHDASKLRQALCAGYQDQPKIFYHLVVSTHWHYYWICSDDQSRRVSSRRGKRSLETWLKGFKKQAGVQSQDCSGGSRKALTGNHESGIQAVAHCDGRIVLSFPDGGQTTTSFRSLAPDEPGRGAGREPGGDEGTAAAACPPCPTCPSAPVRGRCPACPASTPCPPSRACPPPPACPPQKACPPPPVCPPPDCRKAATEAGSKAFRQGVDKACKRVCDLIYKRCRSINPNTALCYQLSEFCATECIR